MYIILGFLLLVKPYAPDPHVDGKGKGNARKENKMFVVLETEV